MSVTRLQNTGFEANKEAREATLNTARRRLVLEGAWRVFARDGLDGATMRAIATEAGCTTGAIYPLFSSKEAVYAELLSESLDRLHAEVASAAAVPSDPGPKLLAAARAFITYYRDRPDEMALGLYLWHGIRPRGLNPGLNSELNHRLERTLDCLRDCLRKLGKLADAAAQLETSSLFAFLIGALVVHQTGRLRIMESDIDAICAVHMNALSTRLQSAGST